MIQLNVIVFCYLIALAVFVQSHPDEIKSLPGLNFDINFKHYSGFLNASETRVLHYWFVESQNDPEKDSLMFWFNGGPGCSSLFGLLIELGPYFVNDDGETLRENPNSWNKFASVVFIESTYGVGYSFNPDDDDKTNDDTRAAKEHSAAIQHFFKLHPKFRSHPTYIFGESYGGIYVPMMAVELIHANADINLKGIGIGNGAVNREINVETTMPFLYHHGFIDERIWQDIQSECCGSGYCNYTTPGRCQELKDLVWEANYGNINAYDIIRDCEISEERSQFDLDGVWHEQLKKRSSQKTSNTSTDDDVNPLQCFNEHALQKYLNNDQVRKALHIPENIVKTWSDCSSSVYDAYYREGIEMSSYVKKLINADVKVLMYYGDTDVVCNFMLGQKFAHQLGLPLLKQKSPWFFNKQVAGTSTVYEGLTFITIKGVGHMAPQWKPAETAFAVEEFVRYPFKQ